MQFMRQIREAIGARKFKRSVMVLDKAQGHNALEVKAFLESTGITVMRMPTASSALNSIERCWSCLKRHFEQRLFESCGYIRVDELIPVVEEIIEARLNGKAMAFANGNKNVWLTVLGGQRC